MSSFTIESSPFGRVVVPAGMPDRTALFYTTIDFDGRLNEPVAGRLTGYLRDRFGIAAILNTCTQVHGATVARGVNAGGWRECDSCDALWSDMADVALGIKVADCLPVTMVDAVARVMANVHSGWRGAVQRIVEKTVDVIGNSSAFDASRAVAVLGPSIRACCFEVGEEVASEFESTFPDAGRHIDRSHAKPHIDLAGLTASLLAARGFGPERIIDTGLCTRCDGSIFHSYRRDRGTGRNLAVAAQ